MSSTINAKRDHKNSKMAAKAADLSQYAQAVSAAKDLETKKLKAREMAEHFEVGGKADFLKAVDEITTASKLDFLVWNTLMKGEGMSTKRFS